DVDEVVVEDASRLFVFETFSLENVAPPAGGITHTQMNRLFFGACSFECFIAPRIPIDGIVSVLLQVRTRLGGEAVGVLRHAVSIGMLDLHHDSRSIDSQHCLRRSCRFVCSGSDRRQRCPEYPHPASLLASCHLTRQCDRHVIIARWSVAAFAYRTRVLAGVLGRLGILRVPVSPPRIPCQTRKPCTPTLPTPRRASCASSAAKIGASPRGTCGCSATRSTPPARRSRHSMWRSEEHTSELQSRGHLVCRLLLEKKKKH